MKSGWLLVTFLFVSVCCMSILHYFNVAENTHLAITKFAMWIHARPMLEDMVFAGAVLALLYWIVSFIKKLEW